MSVKAKRGFTIVELLIVIVVIAILAAISIVAYNGIQNRAENSKTLSAVSAWVKAVNLYKVDNGEYPDYNSCLGKTTTYTGYSGRCYAPETSAWDVDSDFLNAVEPYLGGNYPEPSIKNTNTDASQYRGAMYYHVNNSDVRVYAMLLGVSSCPSISGTTYYSNSTVPANGLICIYRL